MSPRVILITGANRGIGFTILRAMIQRWPSDSYVLACRDKAADHSAVSELPELNVPTSNISTIEVDVTSDASPRAAAETVRHQHGKLDILINNAGIALIPTASDHSDLRRSYNALYNTNVTSVAMCVSVFLPLLYLSPSPRIINISSARGSFGLADRTPPTDSIAYNTSKTALNAVTLEYTKMKGSEKVGF